MNEPINYSAYDDFLTDAAKDDRVGPHELLVNEVLEGVWEASGDEYREIKGVLVTAGNADINFRLSPLPDPAELAERKPFMDRGKKQAIARSITMHKQLGQHYGKTHEEIQAGDRLKVEVVKNKDGFVRIVSFLSKDHAVGVNGASAASSSVPF